MINISDWLGCQGVPGAKIKKNLVVYLLYKYRILLARSVLIFKQMKPVLIQ